MTPHAPLRRSCRLSRQPLLPIHAVGWGLIGFSGLGLRGLTARSVEYPFLFVQRMSLSVPDLAICDDSGLRSCIIQEVYCASYHAVLGAACCACTGPGQRSIQFSIAGRAGLVSCAEVSKDGGAVLQRGRRDLCRRGHSPRAILDPLARSRLAARARGRGDPEGQTVRLSCGGTSKGGKPRSVVTPWAAASDSQPQSKRFSRRIRLAIS